MKFQQWQCSQIYAFLGALDMPHDLRVAVWKALDADSDENGDEVDWMDHCIYASNHITASEEDGSVDPVSGIPRIVLAVGQMIRGIEKVVRDYNLNNDKPS